jgi:gamma-glutamyltranspeptidase
VEATKRAFHDGHRYITDPEFQDVPPLGSETWARHRAVSVSKTARKVSVGVPNAHAEDADTVLLTVADEEGNLVSYINPRFTGFGSGLVAGETGIALQNRGTSFSLDLDHPNSLAPEKRPLHTLLPAVVQFGDDDWAAFGCMGGYMQLQGHVQVLPNLLDHGQALQAALDALLAVPRIRTARPRSAGRRRDRQRTLPPGTRCRAQATGELRRCTDRPQRRRDAVGCDRGVKGRDRRRGLISSGRDCVFDRADQQRSPEPLSKDRG